MSWNTLKKERKTVIMQLVYSVPYRISKIYNVESPCNYENINKLFYQKKLYCNFKPVCFFMKGVLLRREHKEKLFHRLYAHCTLAY